MSKDSDSLTTALSRDACAGWRIQEFGSREVYVEYVEDNGPIHCDVHDCDAWLCFADPIDASDMLR